MAVIKGNRAGARYVHNLLNKEEFRPDPRRARMYRLVREWRAMGFSDEAIVAMGRSLILG